MKVKCDKCGFEIDEKKVFTGSEKTIQRMNFCSLSCLDAKSYIELGKKQGTLIAYKNIIKCLKADNLKFKKKENPYVNNSDLEQYSREAIEEIKGIIKELENEGGFFVNE